MASLRLGIVGLPNVGKSTLFNALTSSKAAAAENYPFCTVEPNVGVVEVPDPRLETLNQVVKPKKKIPAVVEFVDIAGLVNGARRRQGRAARAGPAGARGGGAERRARRARSGRKRRRDQVSTHARTAHRQADPVRRQRERGRPCVRRREMDRQASRRRAGPS